MHSIERLTALLMLAALAAPASDPIITSDKADGFRGIWFTLGQFSEYGDKYSGGLGTYTAKHIPLAVYAPEVNKTFFTYGGTTGPRDTYLLIMAGAYDHDTHTVTRPTIVHDKEGVNDPHDNASIALDGDGHVWIFISGRGRARMGYKYRSLEPYNIDAFEQIVEQEMTYPQPWYIEGKGFLHCFTKYTAGRELYWESSPDGVTWTEDQKLAGMGGHYQTSRERDGRVITAFNYHPGGNVDLRTNLYYVETDDLGETWRTADGTVLETPLESTQNPALIRDYEAEGRLVYVKDINFDADGHPVILIVTSAHHQPGPIGDPRWWTLVRWNGSEWEFQEVTQTTHNYDMGSLYFEGDGTWRMIIPSEPGPQPHGTGGEMALWISHDDGATWTKERMITSDSPHNHMYARRPINAHPDFYAFWADGNPDTLSESHLYFTDKEGETVWHLPYDMPEPVMEPQPWQPLREPQFLSNVTPHPAGHPIVWRAGELTYTDREVRLTELPRFFDGAYGIQTSQNHGRSARDDEYLSFDVAEESHVFVAYSTRQRRSSIPNWLADTFMDTGVEIRVEGSVAPFRRLYRRTFPKGRVTLGGNLAEGVREGDDGGATYFVLVVPARPWLFTRQPEDAMVQAGETHTLVVEAADTTADLTYQWHHNGRPVANGTSPELVLDSVAPEHEGLYDCVVTDKDAGLQYHSSQAYVSVMNP